MEYFSSFAARTISHHSRGTSSESGYSAVYTLLALFTLAAYDRDSLGRWALRITSLVSYVIVCSASTSRMTFGQLWVN